VSRPAGNPPLPASDATYPAGSDPWSSTPTKVDPGLATIAAGFRPDERLPAQVVNFLENAFGKWIAYQDKIEVLNFRNMGVEFLDAGDKLHIQDANNVILWNDGISRYCVAGRLATDDEVPKVFVSSSGAANQWIDTAAPVKTTTGPNQTYQIQHDPTGRILGWLTKSDSSYFAVRSAAGVWGSFSTNQPSFRAMVARYFGGKWVVGGVDTNIPVIYSTTPGDVWTAQTLTDAAATETIGDMAVGGGHIVALGSLGNVWTTPTLGIAWAQTPVASFASRPTAVVYVTPENLFWILCEAGEVYTSDNAGSWTLAFTPPVPIVGDPTGFPGAVDIGYAGAAAVGGIVVAGAAKAVPGPDTLGVMAIGWNGGTEWAYYPAPLTTLGSSPFQFVTHLVGDSRIAVGSRNGASSNGFRLMYSLRT
jgi:hypothetical protein